MFIGVIPARGGSKSIPRKNLAAVGGRPLLAYTAEAAKASQRLQSVILSTDDQEIAAAGRALGLAVPFLRPADLARDDTPILPALAHILDWLEGDGKEIDALVLLQPTSPLRKTRHIDEAIALFESARADTVVSVVAVPHRFHPASIMRIVDGRLTPFLLDAPQLLRRQDKPEVYARNGPAVVVLRPAQVRRGALYGPNTVGYPMDEESSLDIDDPDDLAKAEQALLRRRGVI